jgi:hypothetical protein
MTEIRCQRTEDRCQRTEDRRQIDSKWEEFDCRMRIAEVGKKKMGRWERFPTAIYSIGQSLTIEFSYESKKTNKRVG